MLITPQAVQQALRNLEDIGFVERKTDPSHGRILRVVLTRKGRRVANLCRVEALKAERQLVAVFDDEERKALVDFLLRYMRGTPPAGG